MKTIYIVLPPYLPVPAVLGGAVETLVEMFIEENEKHHYFEIVLFSTWEVQAEEKSRRYQFTKFVYIKNKTKWSKCKYSISRVFHKLFKARPYCLDDYHRAVYQYLIQNPKPDMVIVEGGSCLDEFKGISGHIGKDRMLLHVHLNRTPSMSVAKIFGHMVGVSGFTTACWNKDQIFDHTYVLYNAICIDRFQNVQSGDIECAREKLGFSKEDFVVLFCGRLIEEKGVKELIEAVLEIENPKVKLLLLGSSNFYGAKITAYQQEIKKLAEGNERIIFTGFVHNSKVPVYYGLSQLVAIPSVYEDPAPLVAIEGIAVGKPLLITNSGGMPEYVSKKGSRIVRKESGRLVENLATNIEWFYNHPEECAQMGRINLLEAEKYSENRYYDGFSEIINRK